MSSPKVSIIITTFNSGKYISPLLEVLTKGELKNIEIIIVDNYSTDNTISEAKQTYPFTTIYRNEENIGFSSANNRGVHVSSGNHLLFLNPDTIIDKAAVQFLSHYLDIHPDVAMCGPKILDSTGRFQYQSKRGFPTPFTSLLYMLKLHRFFPKSRLIGHYPLSYLDPDEFHSVDAISGACMMVRRTVFESLGGFDEDFFLFGEDLDLCYRIKKEGWKICYVPKAEVIHFGGNCTKRGNSLIIKNFYSSMSIFYRKHYAEYHTTIVESLIYAAISVAYKMSLLRNKGYKYNKYNGGL